MVRCEFPPAPVRVEPPLCRPLSSYDETGAGIVADGRLPAPVVASGTDEHARFGGVVPQIAARVRLHAFHPVVREALDRAGPRISDIDAVAVTTGPGLSGALRVGPADAKTPACGLPCPGGPAIDRAARGDNRCAVAFPRPLTRPGGAPYALSFPGPNTAAARWAEQHRTRGEEIPRADGAASLQEAVADVLTREALAACGKYGVRTLVAQRGGDRGRR